MAFPLIFQAKLAFTAQEVIWCCLYNKVGGLHFALFMCSTNQTSVWVSSENVFWKASLSTNCCHHWVFHSVLWIKSVFTYRLLWTLHTVALSRLSFILQLILSESLKMASRTGPYSRCGLSVTEYRFLSLSQTIHSPWCSLILHSLLWPTVLLVPRVIKVNLQMHIFHFDLA